MADWHLIFENMTKIAAELSLDEFERNGCEIINVQCLAILDEKEEAEQRYKWLFVLREPLKN